MLRQNIIDDFKSYIKTAFSEIISDMAQDKLNSLKSKLSVEISESESKEEEHEDNGIITTDEEIEGFFTVKSILSEHIALNRLTARDTKSYFGILVDDNNRKWIVRLLFNTKQKYIEIRTGDKDSIKFTIDRIEDIYNYKKEIINTLHIVNNEE